MNSVRVTKEVFNLSSIVFLIIGLVVGFLVLQNLSIYIFALYAAIGFIALSLLRPLQALFVYIILYPLLSTFSISLGKQIPDLSFNRVGPILILVTVLFCVYLGKINLKSRNYAGLWMLIFCLLAGISMFVNYNMRQFMEKALFFMDCFVIPFLLFFLAKNLFSEKKHFIQFTKVLIIPAVYLSVMGIYEYITSNDLFPAVYSPDTPEYVQGLRINEATGILRANGPFMYPETFGVVLAMILLILSCHLGPRSGNSNRDFVTKWMSIFVLPLVGFGLYCCMFRSIWLGTAAALVIRFGIFKGQRLKLFIIIILVAIIALVSTKKIISTSVYKKRISNVETFYARVATYKSALAILSDNLVIGVGHNNFTNTYERYNYFRTFRGVSSVDTVHNAYLAILVENGILGFIAYFSIIGSFFAYIIRLYRLRGQVETKKIAAIFLGILIILMVTSFFDDVVLWSNVNNLFYFLMGVLVSQAHRHI